MSGANGLATYEVRDFPLQCGETLPLLSTAYATLGELNASRTNAVLVLHGYTTGPSMLFPGSNAAEGSWSGLIGPGRAIDTSRYFVVCPNMLGSSYGSTGPGTIDPRTGRPYGMRFPTITMADIVDAQRRLVDALGIERLAAVAGPSLGAMQAFTWATRYPERVARIVAAVGAPYRPAGVVRADTILAELARDPAWRDGDYAQGALAACLTRIRTATLERYGIDAELAGRIPDATKRRGEIERMAASWAREFDPGSLVVLARAIEHFDVRAELTRVRAPLLYVLSRSDETFPPTLAHELAPIFDAARMHWSYVELASDKGHLASGVDSILWADVLADFMATPPDAWEHHGLGSTGRG